MHNKVLMPSRLIQKQKLPKLEENEIFETSKIVVFYQHPSVEQIPNL